MIFCCFAFSKSSVWYSLGLVIIMFDSCFDINFRIERPSSLAVSIAFLTSSFVILAVRSDSLGDIFRILLHSLYGWERTYQDENIKF